MIPETTAPVIRQRAYGMPYDTAGKYTNSDAVIDVISAKTGISIDLTGLNLK